MLKYVILAALVGVAYSGTQTVLVYAGGEPSGCPDGLGTSYHIASPLHMVLLAPHGLFPQCFFCHYYTSPI
jgi:hypothetical protein